MNAVILMGRMTKDCEVRYGGNSPVGRFTLAVDRKFKKDGEPTADFIQCVCFGKKAEFMEQYGRKGVKFAITGEIRTGSYEKDGQRVYTTDVVVNDIEFAESKNNNGSAGTSTGVKTDSDGFMNIPDGIDMELPFN